MDDRPTPRRTPAVLYFLATLAWFGAAGVLVLRGAGILVPAICVTLGLVFFRIGRTRD